MAQLYKMTLYVCDLEENLSLDEIKCLVSERALDGISVSSICRFADEQIGEQVEWDDDIDLNKCNCPTSTWDKYFKPPITGGLKYLFKLAEVVVQGYQLFQEIFDPQT